MLTSSKPASRARSKVTNGNAVFLVADERSAWARRFRDLVQLHEEDLGSPDTLSEAQHSLCRRVATIEVTLEQMEGQLASGEDVDLGLYRDLTGTLARTLTAMGLKRVAKDVPNFLADHFSRPYDKGAA